MAKQTPHRIGDIINEKDILPPVTSLKNFLNQEFIIDDLELKEGTLPGDDGAFHDWYLITAHLPDSEESILLSCGASTVMKQLAAINKVQHLPLPAMAVQHGTSRMIKLV